jgi:hypothetical protein
VLSDGGLEKVTVRERIRTPTGSYEIMTACTPRARPAD